MADAEDQTEDSVNDETGGEDGEGENKSGGKKNLLIIIVGAVLLIAIGGGVGLFLSGALSGDKEEAMAEGEHHEEDGEDAHGDEQAESDGHDSHGKDDKKKDEKKADSHAKKDDGHGGGDGHGDGHGAEGGSGDFVEIPTMIVNLSTDDGTPRYLRLSVQLELEDPSEADAVRAVMPRVVDQFQTYLRELRVRDLRGSAGIYRLQMELLWRVNQAAAPVEIKDVLFQEILIQ